MLSVVFRAAACHFLMILERIAPQMVSVRIVGGPNGPPSRHGHEEKAMFKFWYDAAMLSIEAQGVIGLRMMKFARAERTPTPKRA